MNLKRKSFTLCLLLCLLTSKLAASANATLEERFNHPSAEAKPWTIWYWMHGAVSKEGIRADLEAMKKIGLGGAYLMSIRGPEGYAYPNAVNQLTPEWWEMVGYSMQEADRLGLKLGLHVSDGFALAGGPWIQPEESMQKVVWSETKVKGGRITQLALPQPETLHNFYRDIAVYAIPDMESHPNVEPIITSNHPTDPSPFLNPELGFRSAEPVWLQFSFVQPFTLRNIEIVLFGNNYQSHRFKIMASHDGIHFQPVTQLIPARHGWQNSGFQTTHSIEPTTAQFFRFYWNKEGSEPGSEDLDAAKWRPTLRLKQIKLNSVPRIHQWEGKSGLVWRVAHPTCRLTLPKSDCIPLSRVIQLTKHYQNGTLNARLPAGNWRILRMGHTTTGHTNATGGGGRGLECDKFSEHAVRKQFDHWFGAAFRHTPPEVAKRVLKVLHVDSWECGSQNWSATFPAEFKKRRGYDLLPLLPVLAGYPIKSAAFSEQVLRDVRVTISELVSDVFYTVLAQETSKLGCSFSSQCVAPTMVADGMLHFSKVTHPMGEFWLKSPTHDKPNDILDAIHAARIYGKHIVQAEAFTQLRTTWDEHPNMLKPLMDYNYALGINKLFFHVFVHNPYIDQRPGMTLDGIGLYFQRDQIWWEHAPAMIEYMKRCQAMLQYGEPVIDIAVYTGEEVPRRAMLPDRLVPMLPGIIGEEKVKKELHRLRNEGQPLRVMPVGVTHSANMADPNQWVDALRGYQYNSFNKDALLRLAKEQGSGVSFGDSNVYKIIVLPSAHPLNPTNIPLSKNTQQKLNAFRKKGVRFASLPWTESDFSSLGVERDLIAPQNIAWTHRKSNEANVYFISNQENQERNITLSMRISHKKPEIWIPACGTMTAPEFWESDGNRTTVQLQMAPYESVFVVFRKNVTAHSEARAVSQKTQQIWMLDPWNVKLSRSDYSFTLGSLSNLSEHSDPKVKYYSGEIDYSNRFNISTIQPNTQYKLHLGAFGVTAKVRLNGVECGIVWTHPLSVDITKALRSGINQLDIEIRNTWANAIRGMDTGQPPYAGIATNGRYRLQTDSLPLSGLIGPVQIVAIQ